MPTKMSFVFLTPAEAKQLVSVISDIRDRALVRMFLDTGLFMSELQHLTFAGLDLENKIIKVGGSKARTIPLNAELVLLIEDYLRTRPQCGLQELFLTGRGKPTALSHRAIDKILTKYRIKANLAKKVNTLVLRNTFAVNLCLAEVTFDKLTAILGVTNGETIARYVRAAKTIGTAKLTNSVEKLDTRSGFKKTIDKILPKPPVYIPEAKPEQQISPVQKSFIGREQLLADIQRDLARGQSVLLIGPYGSGKSAILKNFIPLVPEGTLKNILLGLLPNSSTRVSVSELLQQLSKDTIIPFDNIDLARRENIDMVLRAMPEHTFLITAEKLTSKIVRLQQQVTVHYLNKLTDTEMKQLVKLCLPRLIVNETQKELLLNKVIVLANGNPGAAIHLLDKLACQPRITDDHIRELTANNPDNMRDWSNIMILAFSGVIALRYISRGTGDTELYLLSGIIYAFFLSLKTFGGRRST